MDRIEKRITWRGILTLKAFGKVIWKHTTVKLLKIYTNIHRERLNGVSL